MLPATMGRIISLPRDPTKSGGFQTLFISMQRWVPATTENCESLTNVALGVSRAPEAAVQNRPWGQLLHTAESCFFLFWPRLQSHVGDQGMAPATMAQTAPSQAATAAERGLSPPAPPGPLLLLASQSAEIIIGRCTFPRAPKSLSASRKQLEGEIKE